MIKFLKGKEGMYQSTSSHGSLANFTGMVTNNSHSSICCVVPNNCSGFWTINIEASDHITFD